MHIYSQDENLLHISDAIHHPIFLGHQDWLSDFDEYPELAKQTRSRLFAFADGEQSLVFVPHFAYPGLGYLVSEGEKRRWESWKWEPFNGQDEK
jgi:glyoxylase-like metal-dependent hydrolase (beta-lactamase superfamily II)